MTGEEQSPHIDIGRLRALFEGVNAFGRSNGDGSVNRPAFSDVETEARRWFASRMDEAGLAVRRDEAGNLFGRLGAEHEAAVLVGGHLDTLPGGGADAALGLCIALESLLAIKDAGIEPSVPIEIVATSDGAGRFGGGLGARAIAGDVTRGWIEDTVDVSGVRLAEAMAESGIDPWRIFDASRPTGSYKAFFELGIEPATAPEGETPLAIVEAASGLIHWQVRLSGQGGPCRVVPMGLRSDAFAGLAEVAATIPAVIRIVGRGQSRVTVGSVQLAPDRPFEIPSEVVFSMVVEEADERTMKALTAALRALIERAAKSRRLEASIEEAGRVAPVALDAGLAGLVEAHAKQLDIGCIRVSSASARDAVVMQGFRPSALLLLPFSGASAEMDWHAIGKATQLTVAALCKIAGTRSRAGAAAGPVVLDGANDEMDVDLELDDIMLSEVD